MIHVKIKLKVLSTCHAEIFHVTKFLIRAEELHAACAALSISSPWAVSFFAAAWKSESRRDWDSIQLQLERDHFPPVLKLKHSHETPQSCRMFIEARWSSKKERSESKGLQQRERAMRFYFFLSLFLKILLSVIFNALPRLICCDREEEKLCSFSSDLWWQISSLARDIHHFSCTISPDFMVHSRRHKREREIISISRRWRRRGMLRIHRQGWLSLFLKT